MTQDAWIGQTINGRYQINNLLGKGGMSAVYKATDPNLRREVAIKLIHTHLSDNPEFVRRFEEEAAAVARLRHPNIIQVHDFDNQGELYYIVFEYIPGETLQDRLKRLDAVEQRMPLEETLQIMTSMGNALQYAHQEGLVHRDIKPANIMINKRGQAILMDFGIAKISGAGQHTATGMVLGTARYMSPEQVMGEKVDARTDIYALGVTLFEMVNGRPPFESDSVAALMMKHVNEPVPDLRLLRPDVPSSLVAIIEKALAKDRESRYQTTQDFANDLKLVAQGSEASVATVPGIVPEVLATTIESSAGDVTVLERPETQPGRTAVSATKPTPDVPHKSQGNNRLLIVGGAVVAFILIAVCAAAAFSIFRSNGATGDTNIALPESETQPAEPQAIAVGAGGSAEDQELPVSDPPPEPASTTSGAEEIGEEPDPAAESEEDPEPTVDAAITPDFDPLFLTTYTYDGLTVGLALPDVDTERIMFSIDDPQPTIDNGRNTAGTQTLANNSIGPIPHEKGEHTLYVQYIGANGEESEIYSFDYKIDDIVFNFNQQPYDFESEGIPAIFTMFVVDGDTSALYTYNYSMDSKTLDQSVQGVAEAGVIQLEKLEPGEHILYVQATSPGHQTDVVAHPFTIE